MHYFTCLCIFKEEASDTAMPNEDQATGTLEEDQTAETECDKSPSKEDKTGWFKWRQCQKCTEVCSEDAIQSSNFQIVNERNIFSTTDEPLLCPLL